MTNSIIKAPTAAPPKFMGASLAYFNDPRHGFRSEEIESERALPLSADIFAEQFGVLEEHMGVQWSEALLKVYYNRLRDEMSSPEFYAACWDALVTKIFPRDLLAFLMNHVREQREHVDVGELKMQEMDQ